MKLNLRCSRSVGGPHGPGILDTDTAIRDVIPNEVKVEESADSPGTYLVSATLPMMSEGTVISSVEWCADDGTAVLLNRLNGGGFVVNPAQDITFSVILPYAFMNLLVSDPMSDTAEPGSVRPNRYSIAVRSCSR